MSIVYVCKIVADIVCLCRCSLWLCLVLQQHRQELVTCDQWTVGLHKPCAAVCEFLPEKAGLAAWQWQPSSACEDTRAEDWLCGRMPGHAGARRDKCTERQDWLCTSPAQHSITRGGRAVGTGQTGPVGKIPTFTLLCLGLGPQLGSGLVGNLVCRFSLDSLTAPWARLKLALCSGCLASSLPAAEA